MENISINQLQFSAKKLHRIHRIDEAVKSHFDSFPSINEIPVVELMSLFISKGIFIDDIPSGKHINILLQELNRVGQMDIFKSIQIVNKQENRKWYFKRINQ